MWGISSLGNLQDGERSRDRDCRVIVEWEIGSRMGLSLNVGMRDKQKRQRGGSNGRCDTTSCGILFFLFSPRVYPFLALESWLTVRARHVSS